MGQYFLWRFAMRLEAPDFSKTKILVIGDLMLDRYWHGDTSRISPESPVPVVNVNQVEDRPGGAANVALNLVELGSQVTLCGITGDDQEAEQLESILTSKSIHCIFEKRDNQTTITKLRVISRNQQLIRLDFEKDFSLLNSINYQLLDISLENYDLIILSDYLKGTLGNPQEIIQQAQNLNIPVVIDPKGTDFSKYKGATLLTPNQSEFELIAGKVTDDNDLLCKADRLQSDLQLEALLVTRSEKGMMLIQKGKEPYLQPTQAKEIADVTGAGDTVIATLAATYAATKDLVFSSKLANLAAGVVISKLGTAAVSRTELQIEIDGLTAAKHGVVNEEELIALIESAKDKQETIVMTNGCFDILHPGHAAYLKDAASLGDRLIVAVNSDDSVKRLKGETRPINPLEHRMEMLASLSGVDWVVPFTEDTPERIIGRCLPDILVKGGDYKAEDIAGYKDVTQNGGQVSILQFKEGYSTTKMIEKIKQ